jgi:broad specificity phosphatase PhoE
VQSLNVEKIFCSPLPRSVETEQLLGFTPLIVPALTDRNFGTFAGKQYGALKAYCNEQGIDPGVFAPPGGESYRDVQERVLTFLKALPKGKFLFISHAGAVMQVMHALTGRGWNTLHIENCALWVVEKGAITHENWKPWERNK